MLYKNCLVLFFYSIFVCCLHPKGIWNNLDSVFGAELCNGSGIKKLFLLWINDKNNCLLSAFYSSIDHSRYMNFLKVSAPFLVCFLADCWHGNAVEILKENLFLSPLYLDEVSQCVLIGYTLFIDFPVS